MVTNTAYDDARRVETEGTQHIEVFFEQESEWYHIVTSGENGRNAKDSLSFVLQQSCVDAFFVHGEKFKSVELKIERKNENSNFYLETWSNLHERNYGWLNKAKSDYLFYYFLEDRELYIVLFERLIKWAFGDSSKYKNGDQPKERSPGRIYDYKERRQGRRDQKNDTWGRTVPISIIENEVGFQKWVYDGYRFTKTKKPETLF